MHWSLFGVRLILLYSVTFIESAPLFQMKNSLQCFSTYLGWNQNFKYYIYLKIKLNTLQKYYLADLQWIQFSLFSPKHYDITVVSSCRCNRALF